MSLIIPFAIILILVLINGLFVAAEFAIIGVRPSRIAQLVEEGNPTAKKVKDIISDNRKTDMYIATSQLGISLASLGLGMYAEPAIAHLIEGPLVTYFGFAPGMIRGYKVGADDIVCPPLNFEVLDERIQAILRRVKANPNKASIYQDEQIQIDLDQQRVMIAGKLVHLTPTEHRLLDCLVRNLGQVVSHEALLDQVWGTDEVKSTSSLSVYVHYLRRKLGDSRRKHRYIRSKWGSGYWFAPKDEG